MSLSSARRGAERRELPARDPGHEPCEGRVMLRRLRPAFIFALPIAVAAVSSGGASCSSQTDCDCAAAGVYVSFTGILPTDVASFTVSGACGPVPSPPCDAALGDCTADAWSVTIPTEAAGTCNIVVVAKDGEMFQQSVTVTAGGGCCAGFFGDHTVQFTASGGDGGTD
jgi:hypothetical protein